MPVYFRLRGEPRRDRILSGLERLRAQLDAELPAKTLEQTMLLATWNVREFDSPAYGPRTADAYYFIAEIVSRFDLVAVQEVHRDLTALKQLVAVLGWPWRYVVTDTTEGSQGNDERLAFLFDSRKVRFSGLAGELVLPPVERRVDGKLERVPVRQIARSPYVAGFRAGWSDFQLATVHIVWDESTKEPEARLDEIRQVARFLAERSTEPLNDLGTLVMLGDFNIFSRSDRTLEAITDAGWVVPEALQGLPGSNVRKDRFYDQIAFRPERHWFESTGRAGVLDFYESVLRDEDEADYIADMGDAYEVTSKGKRRDDKGKQRYYRTYWRTFQMSDHLPMWLELRIDYSDDYLAGVRTGAPAPE